MERPPENADAADIARFLEEDFWERVAEGITEEADDRCDE